MRFFGHLRYKSPESQHRTLSDDLRMTAFIFCVEVRGQESVAPTALDLMGRWFPALTGWARLCRASGAGCVVRDDSAALFFCVEVRGWRPGHVSSSEVGHFVLPRSLRSVAGAPRTARKKRPATPVGMTEYGKRNPRGHGVPCPYEEKRRPPRKAAATRRGASCGCRGLGRFGLRLGRVLVCGPGRWGSWWGFRGLCCGGRWRRLGR